MWFWAHSFHFLKAGYWSQTSGKPKLEFHITIKWGLKLVSGDEAVKAGHFQKGQKELCNWLLQRAMCKSRYWGSSVTSSQSKDVLRLTLHNLIGWLFGIKLLNTSTTSQSTAEKLKASRSISHDLNRVFPQAIWVCAWGLYVLWKLQLKHNAVARRMLCDACWSDHSAPILCELSSILWYWPYFISA